MNSNKERKKRVEIRFNDLEYNALKEYADRRGMAVAECIRDWVKTLIKED